MLRFDWLSRLAKALVVALLLCLGGPHIAAALYDVSPGEIPGRPGTIIRIWPLEGGGRDGANAFRILYRSIGLKGEIIPVSGAIFIPQGAPPAGGRNIIAWAHPTSGVVPPCAPSLMPDLAGTIWNLGQMMADNYVVVATDYPGLGTDGIHPYLIGESEGRAVLDSVRAARDLPDTGASNRFAVWGHSQGGHAALFTGELAARYAPELTLVGVAAAAPATYLIQLFDADSATATGTDLTSMTMLSWTRLENVNPATLVEPQAMPAFEKVSHDCIESVSEFERIDRDDKPLTTGDFMKVDPSEIEPWRGMMLRNSPGQAPAGAPVFIAQGTADTTVKPQITKQFGEALCRQGVRVSFVELPGVSHTFAARDSAGAALNWMNDRFHGLPAHSDCE